MNEAHQEPIHKTLAWILIVAILMALIVGIPSFD